MLPPATRLLLLALLVCHCTLSHAFLSQLLSLATGGGGGNSQEADYSSGVELAVVRGSSEGGGGQSDPRSSFQLPSLAALHASLKDMVTRGASVPTRCRVASDEAQLWSRCSHLTQADKTFLAVAFTECHFELFTRKYQRDQEAHSCQGIQDPHALGECVKDMNTGDVFPIFIQFKTSVGQVCQQVDHDFARRRSHEAMDKLVDATLLTARSLDHLQAGTEELTRDLHARMERSSSVVMDLLSSHTLAEADRFEALSAAALKIEVGQEGLMTQLTSQTTQLHNLLADSQSIQALINATSADIATTQVDILALQTETSSTLTETQKELLGLKVSQQQHFEEALQSLHSLRSLSEELARAQASSSQAVQQLARDQELAFARAASALSTLHEDQLKAFESGALQLADIRSMQGDIGLAQSTLLTSVKHSSDELRQLARTQRASFAQTGESLSRIQQQAAEVEGKLGGMLTELRGLLARLLDLNLDVLREIFQIHSTLFYVALAPVAYFATATERTKAARFWIFLLLLATLLLELNLVSAMQRFRYQLSQSEFDALRERLRYALSALSALVLVLAALLHRDLLALNHALHERNSTVLNNNHRMLHELIRRTEQLAAAAAPSPKAAASTPTSAAAVPNNPFQQAARLNPAGEGIRAPLATDSAADSLADCHWEEWQQVRVDGPTACCADQRTPPSMMARFFGGGSTPTSTTATPPVKREAAFISETLWSPSSSRAPLVDSTGSEGVVDDAEGDAETVPEGEGGSEEEAPSRLRRSSRSRSRSALRDPALTAPTAATPSKLRKRTPTKQCLAVQEEAEGQEGEAIDLSQPGLEHLEPPSRPHRRRSRM